MKIGKREIRPGAAPYIVAEIGANHGGNLERCLDTMEAAKRSGADAVKLQAYTADTITLESGNEEFRIQEGPWSGMMLWDLYKKCETPFEWFPRIAFEAREIGIDWFASVFDTTSVDMLEKLGCPAYKIASFEIVDLPLIRYAARTGKPVILSTGMANTYEICQALAVLANENAKDAGFLSDTPEPVVLHCVSGYPAKVTDYNLSKMNKFSSLYGVSDHTLGIEVPIAATALGACMIEKHFRLEGANIGEDEAFSLTPGQFARMVKAVHETWGAMQPSESKSEDVHRAYRRSLFVVKDMYEGEVFTHENVRSIRPGHGMAPGEIEKVIGLKASRDILHGEPLGKEMLSGKD